MNEDTAEQSAYKAFRKWQLANENVIWTQLKSAMETPPTKKTVYTDFGLEHVDLANRVARTINAEWTGCTAEVLQFTNLCRLRVTLK
jgi:hypothetical protein